MESINSRIVALRKHLRLNQTQLAQKLGITSQHISMFEAGKAQFSETNLRLICLTFGVNEAWLRDGTGEMMNDEALLSDYEKQVLAFFQRLSPKARKMLIEYAEKLASDEAALRGEPPEAQKQSPRRRDNAPAIHANG